MLMHTHTHIVLAIIAQKWWIYNGAVNYVAWLYGVGFNFFFFHFIHSLCVFWCSFMRHIRYLRSVWIRLYFCFSPIYFFLPLPTISPCLRLCFKHFNFGYRKKNVYWIVVDCDHHRCPTMFRWFLYAFLAIFVCEPLVCFITLHWFWPMLKQMIFRYAENQFRYSSAIPL